MHTVSSSHPPSCPLIGVDIAARDDCFRGIRIAIRAREQELGSCRLRYIERRSGLDDQQRCAQSLAECDGIIAYAPSDEHEHDLATYAVPVINVSARLMHSRFVRVLTDHRAMGRLAGQSLINRGLRQLVSWDVPMAYVHWRHQGICEAVAAAHDVQLTSITSLRDRGQDITASLPQPLGIIGSNDHQARKVIEVLRAKGWQIPQQIAVIGMDNDSQICETCEVPITSVGIDTLRWGSTALDTILALVHGTNPDQPIVWIPPTGVIERESAIREGGDGSLIATIQHLLSQDRALHWRSADLALQAGVSKATLQRHCREALGTTPHQLLHQARLHKAEGLLRESTQTIAAIAKRCGWQARTRMLIAFQQAHGMTPSSYRKLQRNRTRF
ncbi:MAG: helix-turn-helix domain-containing protein [Planctomycetota bacterium]|nr:MAG: helix-turn-helix domain-containing protein [Planctomycetota bacterium]